MVYCHACHELSTNVMGERDICNRCGKPAERVEFHRPWQYYLSGVMLLAAAAVFIWGPLQDTVIRLLLFFGVLVAAYALSSWGMTKTRERILEEVARRKAAEGNA